MAKRLPNAGSFKKGDPRINRTRPGPGRPTEAFKAMCAKLLSRKSVVRQIRRVVRDSDHDAWLGALKTLAAYAHGQPTASVEVKGKLTLEQILARSWKAPKKGKRAKKKGTSRGSL